MPVLKAKLKKLGGIKHLLPKRNRSDLFNEVIHMAVPHIAVPRMAVPQEVAEFQAIKI